MNCFRPVCSLVLSISTLSLLSALPARAEFDFRKDDRVVYIGNGLADRMQHSGWLETLIQSREAGKQLTFRNLGFTGDQVNNRPRNKGFTAVEDFLKHIETDVIFVFFGYNESFADKPDDFKKQLGDMIDKYRALKPNGESEPRFVLFTPISHENLKDRNLPNGKKNNERLAKYAEAVKAVAAEKKTDFVDLFGPSQALYENSEVPLTLNGVHLNDEGNRRLAEVMAQQLLGEKVAAAGELEAIRDAVLDKNWHWHNRYRAVDGNDVWGGRSTLKFVNDQTNAEVLQHELVMLDVMSANRDARIWALAKGSDLVVDDSNVPKPIPVISNVGGGSKSSNAEKEGSLEYVSGKDGLSKITVPEGFEVNLFADEEMFPGLVNPVQMQVDGKGRLWVAAWPTYPKWEPLKDMNDALIILDDENGDGVADKATEFARIHNPLGFEFWNGGVLVASQPDIWFLKDTDGDDVADVRYVYMQGIGSADTHHAANNLIYGPDGAIYWQSGIFLHNNIEHPWGPSLSTGNSAMYRFDPRRYTISFHAGNSPNPHGISFDRWGYHYANDGTGGRAYQVRPEKTGFKMHKLLEKQVRPVPANEVVSSDHFPEAMQGDFLICNTIGFLGIKHYKLHRDGGFTRSETTGKGDKQKTVTWETELGEVWGEPSATNDLLVSTDKNFRPTDALFGEDGALYVADWHNVIIGHMQHNVRDPNRDHRHGRVYRMTAKGRPLQKPVKIDGASIPELLANLEHPVDGVRHRTRIELTERDSKEVIEATRQWIAKFDPRKKADAHPLLEALWLHQQHNFRNGKLLNQLLRSPEPHARVAAQTVQHHWYNVDHTRGGDVPEAEELSGEKLPSGIISDTPELTEVQINTVVERLIYDVKEFQVKAGKKVRVTFTNPDFLPHNIVFTQPKSAEPIAMAAMAMGALGFEKGFIPETDQIIAHSKMLDHQQEEVVEFNAPDKPGSYEFVCTFPGHYILMRGVMKVVK